MKVSDLVTGRKGCEWVGSVGLVIGFDEDSDPIIVWTHGDGSHTLVPGCGEFRKQVKVLSESR